MDLGELPTGIESPLIPILLWTAFGIVAAAGLWITVVAARRGRRRLPVLLLGAVLVLLGLGVGLTISSRSSLAATIDPGLCPNIPDGTYFVVFSGTGQLDPMKLHRQCLGLQFRLAFGTLAGYAVVVTAVGVAQLSASRIRSA